MTIRVERLPGNPILRPDMDDRAGANIQGPSLIRVPDWVASPLGRYYLYFAHHKGTYIRLAYADALAGPWRVHGPGVLPLSESRFPSRIEELTRGEERFEKLARAGHLYCHIASPDVHVDDDRRELRMYYHGWHESRHQLTRVALSRDGLHFEAQDPILGLSYWRGFRWRGDYYALAMPGFLYRSDDGLRVPERGPQLLPDEARHMAVLIRGEALLLFWTRVGDDPERILVSRISLEGDWRSWSPGPPEDVLEPVESWEGADLPGEPSVRGWAPEPVRQLRDPAIFEEGSDAYLLYSVAGESGIAIARLFLDGFER